jgi:hypothetical protein
VRLIGMTASRLTRGQTQLELFDDPHQRKQRQIDRTLDRIQERFGKGSIRRGDTE